MVTVACCTEQSQEHFKYWDTIKTREELELSDADKIYFIHWHWYVPLETLKKHKCIGFHMTDLPFLKGSFAYENLMSRGFKETIVTCFEMEDRYDTGTILMKRAVTLHENKAHTMSSVYSLCAYMITHIEKYGPPMRIPQVEYSVPSFGKIRPEDEDCLNFDG